MDRWIGGEIIIYYILLSENILVLRFFSPNILRPTILQSYNTFVLRFFRLTVVQSYDTLVL